MLNKLNNSNLVTIVINNYNYDRFLRQAIDSALNQTYSHTEVVVVDDGSSDKSLDIIQSYESKVIPVLKSNGGQASAFNAGVKKSKGNIIFFLDSDDLFYPTKVEELLAQASALDINKPLMIFHSLNAVDENGVSLGFSIPGKNLTRLPILRDKKEKGYKKLGDLDEISSPESAYRYAEKYRYLPYLASPTSGFIITSSLAKCLFPIPENGIVTCADDFVVKSAALLGNIYNLNLMLGEYRIHGKNSWYGSSKPRSKEYLLTLDKFLNLKLKTGKQSPLFSHFDSMVSRDYYRDHFDYVGYEKELFRLAIVVFFFQADIRTLKFFLMTNLIALKSLTGFHSNR